jgi:Methyltransferase domain
MSRSGGLGPPLPARAMRIRRVGNRQILLAVLRGLVQKSMADPRSVRHRLLKSLWIELKRFSAVGVGAVTLSGLLGSDAPLVEGGVTRYCPLVLAAISQAFGCKTIFEIGTYRGETAWLLAHNNPQARVITLDLPSLESSTTVKFELTDPEYFQQWGRGQRFARTPEARRITQLYGDSATFDFGPYRGRMDLVYIDASHSFSYVKSDTEAALTMLSPRGTIIWDDYTYYPGIYAYLNDLAPQLDRPVVHILDTRLAMYTRRDLPVGR